MKKTALLLALFLGVFSLTACGDSDSKDSSSESSSSSSQAEESSGEDPGESAAESSAESTAENNSSSASDFKRGTVEGNVYSSDFANVRFTAPEGWTFANDEYIANMMNLGMDLVGKNDEMTKAMLDSAVIYDAVCTDAATGKNIIIMYENLAKEVPDPSTYTVEDYLESVDKQFSSLQNIKVEKVSDMTKVIVGKNEYIKVAYKTTYDTQGVNTNQTYYVTRVGDFMLGIIASSGQSYEDMSDYEKCFS